MGVVKDLKQKGSVIAELMKFLWRRKLWWLIPMIAILLLFGLLMIFTQSSSVAPFIYTLF